MNQSWQAQPTRQQQPKAQIQVQVNIDEDIVVCQCGGLGLVFQAAFLPKHNIAAIGSKPEIVAAPILVCNVCGQRLKEPFRRAADIQEA